MLGDIIYHFLLAYEEEGEIYYITDFKKIAIRYIKHGSFISDLIVLLPWYFLGLASPTLEILGLIKTVRFNQLFVFMDGKQIKPIIRYFFQSRTEKILADPKLREDIFEDHNQVITKMIV